MAKPKKLTNNSDECEIASLLSGDMVFAIPYFQRPYRWQPERLKQLNKDLLSLVDGSNDFHFLGAVIIHGRRSNPSEPNIYEVIDGQQRITTLFLYLAAIVRVLCKLNEPTEAAGLFTKYLLISRETRLASNIKLHPCKDDRAQLNAVMREVLSDGALVEKIGNIKIRYLPATGSEDGKVRTNFRAAQKFFTEQAMQEGIERLRELYTALLENMSVVQIDVYDPTSGPKIFDSLNSRQEPMTIGDLVRNEIFSRVANEHPDTIEQIDQETWRPFYAKFRQDALFDSYFFPYGLIASPSLTKSEVYNSLRERWKEIKDPSKIVQSLSEYQDAFLDLEKGTNLQGHPTFLAAALRRLYDAGFPSSTYPFLMRLSNAAKSESLSSETAAAIIDVIESFLVRRAICGHEPTGLHAVFKRLWNDCGDSVTAKRVEDEVRGHSTVVWPSDSDVKKAILERNIYNSSITPYVLRQYDESMGGDAPPVECWIEHVLPQTPKGDWPGFTKEEMTQLKDRLGNLVLLSAEMNIEFKNQHYDEKRARYKDDSGFKSTRVFAEQIEKWTAEALMARGKSLGEWAVSRWKY